MARSSDTSQDLLKSRKNARSKSEIIRLTEEIGNFHFTESNFNEALCEYQDLLSLTKENTPILAHRLLCETYLELDKNSDAIYHASLYLFLSNKENKIEEKQRAYVTLARSFMNLSDTFVRGKVIEFFNLLSIELLKISINIANDMKSIKKTKEEIAELKAISLFNIGFSYSKLGQRYKASEAFFKCLEISKVFQLTHLLLKSLFQFVQLVLNDPGSTPAKLEIIKQEAKKILIYLKKKKFQDSETRSLYDSALEAYIHIEIGIGRYKKAVKIWKCLGMKNGKLKYQDQMKSCLLLEKFTLLIEENPDNKLLNLVLFEKMADIFAIYEIETKVAEYYKKIIRILNPLQNIMDPVAFFKVKNISLISIAESYRNMYEFPRCVKYYKEQIEWSSNSCSLAHLPLDHKDIASSYLAKAKGLFSQSLDTEATKEDVKSSVSSFLSKEMRTNLKVEDLYNRGKIIEENENMAFNDLIQANETISDLDKNLKMEIYHFLLRFHQETFNFHEAKIVSSKLDNLSEANSSVEICEETIHDLLKQMLDEKILSSILISEESAALQIEALSSDSEVDEIIDYKLEIEEHPDLCGNRNLNDKKVAKSFNVKRNLKGETMLHVAVISGNFTNVKKLVEIAKHPVNVEDGAGWLPIHEACFHNRYQIAEYLIEKGSMIDHPGCDKSTPLFESVHGKAYKISELLINRGANLWHINAEGETLSFILDNIEKQSEEEHKAVANILSLIKKNLGDSFGKWLSLKCSSSARKIDKPRNKVDYIKIIEDDSSLEKSSNSSTDNGVDVYQDAIKNLGSKSKQKPMRKFQKRNSFSSDEDLRNMKSLKKTRRITSEFDSEINDIQPVDNEWLIDDMKPVKSTRKKQNKKVSPVKSIEKEIVLSNPKFESTQIDIEEERKEVTSPVKYRIDVNVPSKQSSTMSSELIRSSETSNELIFTAKVVFSDISVAIPIFKSHLSNTIGWLADEAYRKRRKIFPGENFFGNIALINEITDCAMAPCEEISSVLCYINQTTSNSKPKFLSFKVLLSNHMGQEKISQSNAISRQNSNTSSIASSLGSSKKQEIKLDEHSGLVFDFIGDCKNVTEINLSFSLLNFHQILSILNRINKNNFITSINLRGNCINLEELEKKDLELLKTLNDFSYLKQINLSDNQLSLTGLVKMKNLSCLENFQIPAVKTILAENAFLNEQRVTTHNTSLECVLDCFHRIFPSLESLICYGFKFICNEQILSQSPVNIQLTTIDLSFSLVDPISLEQTLKSEGISFQNPIKFILKGCHSSDACMNSEIIEKDSPIENCVCGDRYLSVIIDSVLIGNLPLFELNLESTNISKSSAEQLTCLFTIPHGQFGMCLESVRMANNPNFLLADNSIDITLLRQILASLPYEKNFTLSISIPKLSREVLRGIADFYSTEKSLTQCTLEIQSNDNFTDNNSEFIIKEFFSKYRYSLSKNLLFIHLRNNC